MWDGMAMVSNGLHTSHKVRSGHAPAWMAASRPGGRKPIAASTRARWSLK